MSMPGLKKLTNNQLLDDYDFFCFDADGCLWDANEPIAGATAIISALLEKNKRVFIVTNNCTKTPSEYVKKMRTLGFGDISERSIISPAVVLVDLLKRHHPKYASKEIYVSGSKALAKSLEDGVGVKTIGPGPDQVANDSSSSFVDSVDLSTPVSAVVMDYDPHFSYLKIMKATNYLRDPEVGFFVTNQDCTFPMRTCEYVIPGTGCMMAAVRAVVHPREPIIFGKPSRALTAYLLEKENVEPARTIMFGDRLDTDIKWANESGFSSCLVLTGVHREEDVERARAEGEDPSLIPRFTATFAEL